MPPFVLAQREMSFWAWGPRKLMKMAQSKMVTARSSEVDTLTSLAMQTAHIRDQIQQAGATMPPEVVDRYDQLTNLVH
jgi:hypothetical protein